MWKGQNYLEQVLQGGGWIDPWNNFGAASGVPSGAPRLGEGGVVRGKVRPQKNLPALIQVCHGGIAKAVRSLALPENLWAVVVAPEMRERVAGGHLGGGLSDDKSGGRAGARGGGGADGGADGGAAQRKWVEWERGDRAEKVRSGPFKSDD